MINLGFYRLLMERRDMGFVEEPDNDCRYTPYMMFVIQSRLYKLIYSLFDENVNIFVSSLYNKDKNRMDVYLKIAKFQNLEDQGESEEILIEIDEEKRKKIENKLNEIKSNNPSYALIDTEELYNSSSHKYSFSWFTSVLEYTMEDSSYNQFIRPEGIYLTFNPNSDYKVAYSVECENILKRVQEFYEKGIILLNEKDKVVENWRLIAIDEKEETDKLSPPPDRSRLYQAGWVDRRFAENIVDFLLERIQGEKFVSFPLPNNLAKRHGIIYTLQEAGYNPFIETSRVKLETDNLNNAKKIADLIDKGFATTYGRVSIFPVSRMSEVYLYSEYCHKNNIGEYVGYFSEGEIVFSVLLKDEGRDRDVLQKKLKDYTVQRLVEVGKISKLKTLSPHDAIEQEYSSK